VHVEEIESLNNGMSVTLQSWAGASSTATVFREGLVVDADDVQVLWSYTDSFFGTLGYAAITRRQLGLGEVIYVGTGVAAEDLVATARSTLLQVGASLPPLTSSQWVERLERFDADGQAWMITINHAEDSMPAGDGEPMLSPFEVRIERA
jgi:hypothetical protein